MSKRIIVCVTNDLCTDQRVQKVCHSLYHHGFEVLLVGRKLKDSLPFKAPFHTKRLRLLSSKGFLFYAEMNFRLFLVLLFSKTDMIWANDTDTILPAYLASRLRRKRLVFDAHELFPEVPEVTSRKFVKKFWTAIENFVFPKLQHSFTVCQSIADYYKKKYGIDMQVVRNVPYFRNAHEITPNNDFTDKKIILYQGAVNVGRGLEWVIDCMPLLDDCVLLIIGTGDKLQELQQKTAHMHLTNKVHFLGKMSSQNLLPYTFSADIGLCLLENQGLSYYYSLPNRVFDYMQAGVPILATSFPEISAVVGKYETGVLVEHYEPHYLASVIADMLADGKAKYAERLQELSEVFCWEKEEKRLFQSIFPK